MMFAHRLYRSCVRHGLATAVLMIAHPAFASEPAREVRPEASLPAAQQHEPMKHHDHASAGKREFRAIHNMDEMHRMGGAPGMGLEGGRIQMPAAAAPDQRPDGTR